MEKVARCPNCESRALYKSEEVSAGGGNAPNYLPGLASFWAAEKFCLVTCKDCGLTRFFARSEGRARLRHSKKWKPLS